MRSRLIRVRSVGLLLQIAVCVGALASEPAPLVRLHSIGSAAMAAAPGGSVAREIAAVPETAQLVEQTLARFSASSPAMFDGVAPASAATHSAPLMRPLLEDVLRSEAFLEVQGREGQPRAWWLAVAVGEGGAERWRSNLTALLALWKQPAPARGNVEGFPSADVVLPGGWKLQWVEGGGWIVLGVGDGAAARVAGCAKLLKATGRPLPAIGQGAWLEVQADLAQWAKRWGWDPGWPWPQVDAAWAAQDASMRTTGRLRFPEAVTGSIPPWNVPTNTVAEPLIGFTALRGVAPLLSHVDAFKKLGVSPAPNEIYGVAQGVSDSQVFVVFPLADATNRVRRMAGQARDALPSWAKRITMGEIAWREKEGLVAWRGLPPIVTPAVVPIAEGGREYAVLELFPRLSRGATPPELLRQLQRPNLVYYDWELTQQHLQQCLHLTQLASFLVDEGQLRTNMLAYRWLKKVEGKLGNTVTEGVQVSAKEWSVTRKSDLGLSAKELVGLVRWLENTQFPAPRFQVPLPPAPPANRKRTPAAPPAPGR